MKWIGQNIYDLISKFRNDVYLEDISSGTIASGGNLGLDSNNKIVKQSDTGITDLHGAGVDGSDNQLLTDAGDGTITSEANLTFDGSNLTVVSATEAEPVLTLKTTHTTKLRSGELKFLKDATDTEDGEKLGLITFYGENESNANTLFAQMQGKISESDDGAEGGLLELAVASHDGDMIAGLLIQDGDANAECDVTIAAGASSVTTVSGTLTMGSTATLTNAGLVAVANQSNITGLGTISSGVWNGTAIALGYGGTGLVGATDGKIVIADGSGAPVLLDVGSSTGITTLGTIATGVWQGTAIAQAYIANDAINGDKIADDAVDSEHYTDGSIDNAHIADDAIDSEHYADGSIDTAHIADDQVTFAKAIGVTPNVYGTTIKVLPSDFMANDDGGVTKTVQFVDEHSSGLKPGNSGTELLAFVSVPEGMKITLVDVYASSAFAVDVIEFDIHQIVSDIGAASIGTGNANTQINVTDTNSTATNFFMIQVTTTATGSRVFGALVTIAAQ